MGNNIIFTITARARMSPGFLFKRKEENREN